MVGQAVIAFHTGWNYEVFVVAQRLDGFDTEGQRLSFGRVVALGYLNDSNDFAQFLIAVAPWLWPYWRRGRFLRNWCIVVFPTLLLLYGVMLTRSRGGVLSVLLIMMLRLRENMKWFRNLGPAVAAGCIGVAMLAAGVTGGREISTGEESAASRIEAWHAGLDMLRSHPLTGVGFGSFMDYHVRVAHNSYVHCFAELGLLGYFCWLALLLLIHSRLVALTQIDTTDSETAEISPWAAAFRYSFYGFLAGAFFLSRTYTPTLYLLVGFAIALHLIGIRLGHSDRTAPVSTTYVRTAALAVCSIAAIYVLVRIA
jgi:putative inorganic carbon (hco3(-)) transporter